MKFANIQNINLKHINYSVNVSLRKVPIVIKEYQEEDGLLLNSDFQRGHVWNEIQFQRYIEYLLQCGISGRNIYFNHPGWMDDFKGDFVLIDGLQRLTAIIAFFENRLRIFNKYYFNDFEDTLSSNINLIFNINNLQTRKEVLQWYLNLNSGGVVHTEEELNRVREMLKKIE